MKISASTKERFCKDCNIPLRLFQEPYFTDRLQLYDPYYGTLAKWEVFTGELSGYSSEQDYFQEYNRIKESAIRDIQAAESYQRFNSEDMNRYRVTHASLPGRDIFKPSNDGKRFISFDMKKANFSALHHYAPEIFHNADTWEAFIGRYTDSSHIIHSKYIRQVILGSCNPKRHITYEKYLMDIILTQLEEKGLPMEQVTFFSNDEIVLDASGPTPHFTAFPPEDIIQQMPVPVRAELFTLHRIQGTDGYYKEIITENQEAAVEFKCLDNYILPFVIRQFRGEEVTESDKVFYYEGMLAKFIEVPQISIRPM